MMSKYMFPIVLIILEIGAAVVYAFHKDLRMTVYWICAAVLNICVITG